MLEQLSAGANGAETASKRCQRTLLDVQRLLDPDSLTQYKFRKREPVHTFDNSTQSKQLPKDTLSSFAKMVLQTTDVQYRYLTPESPEPDIKPHSRKKVTEPQPNGYFASHHLTPSSQPRQVHAVVPSSISPAQRAGYQYIPDEEALAGAQFLKAPDRRDTAATNGSRTISVDQRRKGDLAVRNLQNLLLEIFDAENHLEIDGSGAVYGHAANIFTTRDTADSSSPVLQSEAQNKLDICISKAVSAGRLLNVEVDHLARAQRLCEGATTAVETLSLLIGEDWSEQDVEEWLLRLSTAENGLTAARSLIRVMNGAAQQKELQSEDFLKEVLEALKTVIEGFLVPIVEEPAFLRERIRGEKDGPPPNPKFVTVSTHRKFVLSLLQGATRCFRLLGDLLVKINFEESAISSVEYLCKSVIFAENTSTEKDSALGIQNFETMRRCAMDVLAKIFTKYTEQRQYIFDEILVSLEKLPATKQSARQYRLQDCKPIQLVSALLMRLVQTSATKSNEALKLRSKVQDSDDENDDSEDASDDESEDEETIKVSTAKASGKGRDLISLTKPLHDAAQTNARYIVNILVTRALATSKSSEEPYRKLLDIFTEDFLNVLGSSDWPAAELLLRVLLLRMIGLVERESSSVPSRTLALELLGAMGSGILELQIAARDAARAIDTTESQVAQLLRNMVQQLEAGNVESSDVLAFDGPYRIVIEYLEARSTGEVPQLQTARGYHLMEWAFAAVGGREGSADSDASDNLRSSKDLHGKLKNMFLDPQWLDEHSSLPRLSTDEGRLAAKALTLNSTFCKAFNRIFSTLLTSMSSEHSTSTVKARSLKSVVTLLEKDATILERNSYVLGHIFRCAADSSPLVRDAALGLIEKCMSLQPNLSTTAYERIIARTHDAAIGVRKRAMKLLKEIYLRNDSNTIRSAIANAIIARIDDSEDSVIEIARTTMEETWFQPLYGMKLDGERTVQARLAYGSQAALFIETVKQSDDVLKVLEALLKRLLTKSKAAGANEQVCKTLIAVLFDGIIDNKDIPGPPPQAEILRSLTIFARSSPPLFTPTQLERLEPYTQNLTTHDDLDVYRSVITILRYVVPYQPVMNQTFLKNMQMTLLKSITRLQKTELNEVAPCLWTISGMIDDTQRLATTMISVLHGIYQMRAEVLPADEQKASKLTRLVTIAGEFGNACDFDKFLADFKRKFDWYKGDSVPGLIVEVLCPYTSPKQPLDVRLVSLEAICTVSQAWPKQFLRADVTTAFEIVFKDRGPSLEEALLSGLAGFFKAQEVPDENDDVPELGSGVATGTERLGRTYVASDQDGASTSMAQRFLSQILHIALSSYDERSFVAARLTVSINKQGLVHPKESGPALVALETCPNKAIASEAFKEHKAQHQKHETLFEKEYMRAVQRTFEYQHRVIRDAAGYTGQPPTSKMHLTWEVLKIGKAQVRKKFLGKLVDKLDFDPSALEVSAAESQHLLFVRFCAENLAFFEYEKVDDLLHLLSNMEKTFATTGSSVAQAIESEVLKLQVDGLVAPSSTANGTSETMPEAPTAEAMPNDVDPARLRQLALSARILTLIWETRSFLVRLWNMQKHMKSKKLEKDINRTASRATNAPSLTETYIKRVNDICSPLNNEDSQRATCSSFVELISVDSEVKIGSDEEAEADLVNGYDTPSEGTSRKSPSAPPSGSGRGRKRKSSMSNGTPRKRGRPSLGKRKSTTGSKYADDDDEDGGWD